MEPAIDQQVLHIDNVLDSSGHNACGCATDEPGLRSPYADDPEMEEILDLFLDDLRVRVADIVRACAADRFAEVERIAHQLKGAGGSYGFPQLSEAAHVLEIAARQGERVGIGPALDALVTLDRRIAKGRYTV